MEVVDCSELPLGLLIEGHVVHLDVRLGPSWRSDRSSGEPPHLMGLSSNPCHNLLSSDVIHIDPRACETRPEETLCQFSTISFCTP